MAKRSLELPQRHNLIHLEHVGNLINAVVDEIEGDLRPVVTQPLIVASMGTQVQKGDVCYWITESGERHEITVEDAFTDWGLTTARLRIADYCNGSS